MAVGSTSLFQSTLPQGERPYSLHTGLATDNFNPRSHKGSDQKEAEAVNIAAKFQSTLPQGERLIVDSGLPV
mgnify:FL=1